jgi:hypothetical protein
MINRTQLNLNSQSKGLYDFLKVQGVNSFGALYLLTPYSEQSNMMNGSYKTIGAYVSTYKHENNKYYPVANDAIELSQLPYDPSNNGKKVYLWIGDFLIEPSEMGFNNIVYEDLYAGGSLGMPDYSLVEVGKYATERNPNQAYVLEPTGNFDPTRGSYWQDGDDNVTAVRISETYDPQYFDRTLFLSYGDKWHSGQGWNTPEFTPFPLVKYQDVYVNGKLDLTLWYFYQWLKADDLNTDILYEGGVEGFEHASFKTKVTFNSGVTITEPVKSNNPTTKIYVDSLGDAIKSELNENIANATAIKSFITVDTLYERNSIPLSARTSNMHVAVQEDSTNLVNGVLFPRTFVLKPHYNPAFTYVQTVKTYVEHRSINQWSIQYNYTNTSLHPTNPNHFSSSTATAVSLAEYNGGTGYVTVINTFDNYGTHCVLFNDGIYKNGNNITQLPEVGQSLSIYEYINGAVTLVSTVEVASASPLSVTNTAFYSGTHDVTFTPENTDYMGVNYDQSDVWHEMPFFDSDSIRNEFDSLPTLQLISFTGAKNGVNTTFSYTEEVREGTLQLYVNGLMQSPFTGDDFSVNYSTKVVTLSYGLEPEDKIFAYAMA